VSDQNGDQLVLRFYNQLYLNKRLIPEEWVTCVGKITFAAGKRIMANPVVLEGPAIIPIYLQSRSITSRMLQQSIRAVLADLDIVDPVPESVRRAEGLADYRTLLTSLHLPKSLAEAEHAREQLAFSEAWTFFRERAAAHEQRPKDGWTLSVPVPWLQQVVAGLPFPLTNGQKRVVWDCIQDMGSGRLMTRLLNGDVGSGKTVIAALLAAATAQAGKRSLVLVPTEVLAQQHFQTFSALLKQAGCRVALWTGALKDDVAEADIVMGTHALLQESFPLRNVGFVVVDEQHRFGVRQRAILRDREELPPHVLTMTATPIPRTLALVLFADLTISQLTEKPARRKPVETLVVRKASERREMEQRIKQEVAKGNQVFVLCPLITETALEEGELGTPAAILKKGVTVEQEVVRLRKEFPYLGRIEALHGKQSASSRMKVLEEMQQGEIAILVATSVIEVGIDIPRATVMVIENAERFGLAQLHQLRGRVGRGSEQSYTYLCTEIGGGPSYERLQVVAREESGFAIAEYDLEVRGPGDLAGIAQSGLPEFSFASLSDVGFLQRVRERVQEYAREHPEFLRSEAGIGVPKKDSVLE
jgi:ATP-dependent DNA helicase RecG